MVINDKTKISLKTLTHNLIQIEMKILPEHKEIIVNLRKEFEKPDVDENIENFLKKLKNVSLCLPDFNEKNFPLVCYLFFN
jgi:hypothetical protein